MNPFIKKTLATIFLSSLLIACSQPQEKNGETEKTDSVSANDTAAASTTINATTAADSIAVMAQTEGDLDKDSIAEKVILYDTKVETDLGTQREIHIFKNEEGIWKLWHKSIGAVLPSAHGGMMGDPFESISIERGCIVINHFGGSRDKWHYTHRYRFQQGDWFLIGTTIGYGTMCESQSNYDYNVSTGKVVGTLIIENCKDDEVEDTKTKNEKFSFVTKPEKPVLMDGFYPGTTKVNVPNRPGAIFYY